MAYNVTPLVKTPSRMAAVFSPLPPSSSSSSSSSSRNNKNNNNASSNPSWSSASSSFFASGCGGEVESTAAPTVLRDGRAPAISFARPLQRSSSPIFASGSFSCASGSLSMSSGGGPGFLSAFSSPAPSAAAAGTARRNPMMTTTTNASSTTAPWAANSVDDFVSKGKMQHSEVAEAEDVSRSTEEEDDNAEVLIECRDVYKSFGEKHILRGASFKIREGEAVGIIGPSGTGKSTVLRIMAGLLAPDKGEVFVCGKKRQGLISDEAIHGLRIGLVFQSAALFDSLTVRENVGFMLYEHSDLSNEEIAEHVTDSLASVGLKGVEERLPSELSGGMKKRVALARAIISDDRAEDSERELIMYDEPTAGLDPIASTVVEDLIRSVHIKGKDARGKTGKISSYVVVTHQHSTIRRAVDRVLFLHDGKVVWHGPTAEFETTSNPIVRQFADGSLKGPIRY